MACGAQSVEKGRHARVQRCFVANLDNPRRACSQRNFARETRRDVLCFLAAAQSNALSQDFRARCHMQHYDRAAHRLSRRDRVARNINDDRAAFRQIITNSARHTIGQTMRPPGQGERACSFHLFEGVRREAVVILGPRQRISSNDTSGENHRRIAAMGRARRIHQRVFAGSRGTDNQHQNPSRS